MLSLSGIYQNGRVQLEKPITSRKPMKIIITFLEEQAQEPDESKTVSLQTAFTELRTLCAEEQYELVTPIRHNRTVEF